MNNLSVVLFDKSQQRKQFDCGNEELNRYLHQQISQDAKRNVASPFVLLDENHIIGFYTLSASAVNVGDLPEKLVKEQLPQELEMKTDYMTLWFKNALGNKSENNLQS